MTTAIIGLLAALVPFIIWLIRREMTKQADPLEQNRERYKQIDADIAKGDSNTATAHADDDLDELERLQHGANRQPGSDGNQG